MKILMVITSHDQLGNTGRKTGFWLEELAAPYFVFKDSGAEVTLASPKGGRPPLDPKSNEPEFRTDLTRRFEKDACYWLHQRRRRSRRPHQSGALSCRR
jgi:putative intracellular protease/amidase